MSIAAGDGRVGAVGGLLTCLLWAPLAVVVGRFPELSTARAVANVGAVGGFFTLSGPLNSGDGIVGGMAAPVGAWLVWIGCVSVWRARGGSARTDPRRTRRSATPLVDERPT